MGPFSQETTQSFLKQGGILRDDLAWTPGLAEWTPLAQVLLFSATQPAAAPSLASGPAGEPATAKQKAFLTYMGIPFSSGATKEQAAVLVNEAMENPKLNARALQWSDDRLTLHSDLFAAEAQEKKDARANRFFEACQNEGADRLADVTPAHCQVLVTYLDVNFPNWDANEHEAARKYFFPAVAEKFPHLVRKAWRGKLRYPDGPRVAPEILQGAPAAAPHGAGSPFAALVRGIALGSALLLVLYVAMQLFPRENATATTPAPTPSPEPVKVAREPVRERLVTPPVEPVPQETPMAVETPPAEQPPAEPAPVAPAPKLFLVITKATAVQAQYGLVKLTVGQSLKIISREGAKVRALLNGSEILTIPVEATDLAAPAQ